MLPQKSSTLPIIWGRTRLNLESMLRHKSANGIPFFAIQRTNYNGSHSIPTRVHSAQFKDKGSKLSGEMRTDKRANNRYRIGKPCIGGTHLQELHCEQTVRLSSALLCWEIQILILPNEGPAKLWLAWRKQVSGHRKKTKHCPDPSEEV